MKTKLYQIYDRVAEQVVGPIMAGSRDGAAIRNFTEVLQDKNTELGKHPMDYELRHIGEQDLESGGVTSVPVTTILTGAAWIREQANPSDTSVANGATDAPLGLSHNDRIIER